MWQVSFFMQCIKKQLITLQNFNIQTCFSQFLWFFSLTFWSKGQIISRIHLILPNAYKLMSFDRNINGNRDVKFLEWSVIICLCNGAHKIARWFFYAFCHNSIWKIDFSNCVCQNFFKNPSDLWLHWNNGTYYIPLTTVIGCSWQNSWSWGEKASFLLSR